MGGEVAPMMMSPNMMMPSGQSENMSVCPQGMEYLLNTSMVLVRQQIEMLEAFTGFDTNNRYEVLDMAGRRIYLAAEQSFCCVRWCYGVRRPWTIIVLNNQGGMCLRIKKKCTCCFCLCCGCCCNEIQIHTATDIYLGKVTQDCCECCCPHFTVWDGEGNKALTIKGPCNCCMCCTVKFHVKDLEGNEVGLIQKKWGGVIKEAFTTADTFGVTFPMHMDPRLKTLLLGSVLLIDFMYFESGGSKRTATPMGAY